MLTLDSLTQMGAFTGAPVEKEITWDMSGEEFSATVYVRPSSYRTVTAELAAVRADKDTQAAHIASSICDAEGKAVFTADDITGDADPERGPMHGNLVFALLVAIGEVNGLGKKKASKREKKSGTSSS